MQTHTTNQTMEWKGHVMARRTVRQAVFGVTAVAALIGSVAFVPVAHSATGVGAGADNVSVTSAARSTWVALDNFTGCEMVHVGDHLDHGEWTATPPSNIPDRYRGQWGSESNGFLTGTEGDATYQLHDCDNRALKGQWVKVHWDNPYIGSNSYNWSGTSSALRVSYSGGSGNNATVAFTVRVI
jgi:hypothetical protein